MRPAEPSKPAYVIFKIDAPRDITKITYGGRLFNRSKGHIDFLHSFDGGKTWEKSYTWSDNTPPWDVIHYETVQDIPPGTKCALQVRHGVARSNEIGLFAVRMEANYMPADTSPKPLEVTFSWREVQEDYSKVSRATRSWSRSCRPPTRSTSAARITR